ncbi:MAG: MBL fold metallo-hydrolase [Pyrobaculum sp.]
MEIIRVVTGPLLTNTYVLCEFDECIIVDPGGDLDKILKAVGRRSVAAVVATHLHFDHVYTAAELVEIFNTSFYASPKDWEHYYVINSMAPRWGFHIPQIPSPTPLGGKIWKLNVVPTPGHTPGSVSLIGQGYVLTGDVLFYRSVGRVDLPLGDWNALVESVCRLYQLPGDYIVYPGHGPESTIGEEAEKNLFIHKGLCK